jgi:hypothetical protein
MTEISKKGVVVAEKRGVKIYQSNPMPSPKLPIAIWASETTEQD